MDPSPLSPLDALVDAHVLLAGPVLGLVGAGVLRLHGGARAGRAVAWACAAKAVSTLLVAVPLAVVSAGRLPRLLGAEPLGRLPWLGLAFGFLLLALSALAEWPFFHGAAGRGGRLASLGLSLRANAVCLVLLAALYLPFCSLGLLGAARGGVSPPSAGDAEIRVLYLRGGGLFQRGLQGPETCLASGLAFGGDARLFARRGGRGWDLWIQERDRPPRRIRASVAPEGAEMPCQEALHVKLRRAVRTAEAALPETWGRPAELAPEADAAWSLRLGRWSREGVEVASRDLADGYRVALDTPLLSWVARCGTRLPGDRLLFQMGPYLWLLELETRRLRLLAEGQGPQVARG